MKRSIIITALALFCISTFFSFNVFAQSNIEKYLGDRVLCLDIINIRETKVLDDQTILFETYGGRVYINRLPATCFDLFNAGAFAYETSISRLCGQDFIKVIEPDSSQGNVCGLGKFYHLKGVRRIHEALKLLIDEGVLKKLVKEGAFETAFPEKKNK